ncbi:hypothetical protein PIB30_084194 [Stylosanthes scabra]|uniref:Uncharacterized protein n=1 Tax=Stylosanthes scabra TaxID=79078 RepID=A0ABU6ZRS9_9FABA|nr:hypothetical protein [Stylosanthes scabra]
MTCLLVHFREKEVRKAWRKLGKDMESKDRRKKAKVKRADAARPRPTTPAAAPLRRLKEVVNDNRTPARSRSRDRVPARLRWRDRAVASGSKLMKAKMGIPRFRAKAYPFLRPNST